MAELFGREDGVSHGRGGSMHMFDLENRFMGGYGIVGGNLPLAAGMALASDYQGTDEVTVCVFGDGASNQGTFGETLNLAALWKLPVVFMVTNNQFGMGTALERHSAQTDLHRRGDGFGVPGMRCDGMDVVDTYEVMREAIRRAREERQPILVEAITYRFRGHSMADPEEYRTKEQVAEWRKRDPITSSPTGSGAPRRRRGRAVRRGGGQARRRGGRVRRQATFPPPESLYDHIYVLGDQVKGWYSVDERSAGVHRGEDERSLAEAERGPEDEYRRAVEAAGEEASSPPTRRRRDEAASSVAVMRYREALNQALREEMQRDERVFLMGEDIGVFNGAFKVTAGLLEEFGEKRVRDTPISENTIVGMGVGAAMTGLRPVVELMTINFSLLAMDQIVNHMATIHYMFGGQAKVPMVVRMPQGAGHQLGPTHSHCLEALYLHVPGMLRRRPVHRRRREGPAEGGDPRRQPGRLHRARVPLRPARRRARRRRPRASTSGRRRSAARAATSRSSASRAMALTALKAADILAEEHEVEAEVIDPRTLRPLDLDTILESVRKTNRAVIVEEGWPHGGVGGNLAALIQEQAFDHLDAPVARVTGADLPMPYSKPLEQIAYPHEPQVVEAVLATFRDL